MTPCVQSGLSALYFDADRPERDDLDAKVGVRLRELRRNRGFTQAELASRLRIGVFELGRLERGFDRIGAAQLIQLSIALDCRLAEFWSTL
jgi:transcriptional regulator with XRE-family HTH domain